MAVNFGDIHMVFSQFTVQHRRVTLFEGFARIIEIGHYNEVRKEFLCTVEFIYGIPGDYHKRYVKL